MPAEGCLGLNFKAEMNQVGGAALRTPRQWGGDCRDPAWKASHGTREPRRYVTADLNVDREKSVSVQDIYGCWVPKMEQARSGGRPTRGVPERWAQPSKSPCPALLGGGSDLSSLASPPNTDGVTLPLQVGRLRPHC